MNRRAKSNNRFKTAIGWTISLLLLISLTVLSVQRKSITRIENLEINILQIDGNKSLITKADIGRKINAYLGYDLKQATVIDLNLNELEEILSADERIKDVNIYIDASNKVHVDIVERKIIVRIKDKDISYYLDEDGNKINIQVGRAVRVPLITGAIEPYNKGWLTSKKRSNLKDVFTLSKSIAADDFLSALIEQMNVNTRGKVSMVPKIGKERINLSVEDLDEKLYKLKYFYKNGLPREGWSKFSILDLDIRDQVVATLNPMN